MSNKHNELKKKNHLTSSINLSNMFTRTYASSEKNGRLTANKEEQA